MVALGDWQFSGQSRWDCLPHLQPAIELLFLADIGASREEEPLLHETPREAYEELGADTFAIGVGGDAKSCIPSVGIMPLGGRHDVGPALR